MGAPHYARHISWGRFITILVLVTLIVAVTVFVYLYKKVKSNQYFGTVIPSVSADTIYDTSTLAH